MAQTTAPLGQVLRRYVSQVIVAVDGSGSEEEQDTSPPNKLMSVRQSSALKMQPILCDTDRVSLDGFVAAFPLMPVDFRQVSSPDLFALSPPFLSPIF